jgi:four helix bundle protein
MSSDGNAASAEQPKISSYRDLVVWVRAVDLVETCYRLTQRLPRSEIYGLASQIRRAAVSVPANIAEGHGRRNLGEYLQHLSIANGSLKELETHLLIATRLNYFAANDVAPALDSCAETGRMLSGLLQKLRQRKLEQRRNEGRR